MKKFNLTTYIFLGLVLGVLVGALFPGFASGLKPLADIFLRMIKMIIAPLLFATLVVGIAGHGSSKGLGRLCAKTFIYFEIVTTIALLLGLGMANFFQVGSGITFKATAESMNEISKFAQTQAHNTFADTFIHMVPTSVVDAMARGDILQVVVFAVIFSIAIIAVGHKAQPILDVLNSLSEVMFKFTEYVMYFAPIGVFAAIASTIGKNGIGILGVYVKLIGVLYLSLFIFVGAVLFLACKIVKIPFIEMLKTLRAPALLAFSTASSEAALPKAMEIMEKFGVPKNIVGFVMPTGYTFNLDGSTLYLALATLFVAQMAGVHLPLAQQFVIMLTLMLTSKGMAAVPRVSLVVLTGTLTSFNLPVAGVAILLGIDQILDMGRTTVNLIGNCVATVVIARWEKSFNYEKMNAFIQNRKNEGSNGAISSKPPIVDNICSSTGTTNCNPEEKQKAFNDLIVDLKENV